MTARAARLGQPEVIDLLSDDGSASNNTPQSRTPLDLDEDGNLSPLHGLPYGIFRGFEGLEDDFPEPPAAVPQRKGQYVHIDGEDIFIPDEEDIPPVENHATELDAELAAALGNEQANGGAQAAAADFEIIDEEITVDSCLRRVLEIFPDIDHEHVSKLWTDFDDTDGDYQSLSGQGRLDNIINQLISATSYPKAEKGKQALRKRKRDDSVDESEFKQWQEVNRPETPAYLKGNIRHMLKSEFPEFSVQYINDILSQHKHVYQSYLALAAAKDRKDPAAGRGRPSTRNVADASNTALNTGWPTLPDELNAARRKVIEIRAGHAKEVQKKRLEEENLQRAKDAGETTECSACYDDLPMNRQIHCDGTVAHFICFECIETYISSEVGEARCRVLCTAGCGAPYAPNQLNLLSNKQLLEKLAELEQEKAIRDAELDDLEECPCCDYKAILPPIEEDFEFRCANPDCEMVTCRRCKAKSHIPLSCEEHAKDNKLNSRHTLEEAMTAALIRSCNKCKKQFIKEAGCNKMACSSCGNLQCYVCSQTIKDYNHFDQNNPGAQAATNATQSNNKKCPLYDNVEERHEREVKEAEEAARKKILDENPDVQQEDLEIKVSDAVKKAANRRVNGAGGLGAAPYAGYAGLYAGAHMLGGFGVDGADDDDDEDDDVNDLELRLQRALEGRVGIHDGGPQGIAARERLRHIDRAAAAAQAQRRRAQLLALQRPGAADGSAAAPAPAFQGYIPVVAAPGVIDAGGWPNAYPDPFGFQAAPPGAGVGAAPNLQAPVLPAVQQIDDWQNQLLNRLQIPLDVGQPQDFANAYIHPLGLGAPANNARAGVQNNLNDPQAQQNVVNQRHRDQLNLLQRAAPPARQTQAGNNQQAAVRQQDREAALQTLRAEREQRQQRMRDLMQQDRLRLNLNAQQRFHQQRGLNDRMQRNAQFDQLLAIQDRQNEVLRQAARRYGARGGGAGG